MTTTQLPPWPARPVSHGPVALREFSDADLSMVQELSADPYVPRVGTLPPNATRQEALDYIDRQRGRLAEGIGFSFAIAEAGTGRGVGGIGLWLAGLAHGRATAGYSVTPSARGRCLASAALTALTSFAWTIPELHRIELYIEPWNTGSVKTAERAGFEREGLLRQPPGNRRPPPGHAALRSHQGKHACSAAGRGMLLTRSAAEPDRSPRRNPRQADNVSQPGNMRSDTHPRNSTAATPAAALPLQSSPSATGTPARRGRAVSGVPRH